ncbi:MAG: SulP family inorganic anion transporter [Saprospiraceae bacterium]|nr:SulP family inorganic anion transporter [Saprospiraceae bacterium]MBK8850598.1 SulP family inorganic anion transporter [Saprospiraceae bacterium]MBK9689941.1 SulP family inorganic anion transporter [Saprospiraceae bacterium]
MRTNHNMSKFAIPKDGWEGFKENFSTDAISGFIVFLLALPLSLGIAKASDFPPLMGVLSAIIGGLVVSFFAGSRLTIKGPAAGLIVIVAGAVADFGGGETGWHLALGAMVVAGLIQILFGLLKLGKLSDFFPLSAIHGMLAAIGMIIIAKQIPVLLGVDPNLSAGKDPLELIAGIPQFIKSMNLQASSIGILSLLILMGLPLLKNKYLKKVPLPLLVLAIAMPLSVYYGFKQGGPSYLMVKLGNFIGSIHLNASMAGVSQTGVFVKYVIMFALVGSLESLLTVKAIDMLDPYKRKSNSNQDLIAVGIGNTFAALLGGLPMISEVARSSANVNSGAKTRWANFFHGVFILIFLIFATPLIEMIPNAALAAMLITVGVKLAHPKEFVQTFKIGKEQLGIFLVTLFFTLLEDLLVGIAAGITLKLILHVLRGTPISALFKAPIEVSFEGDDYLVSIEKAAVFSNFIGIKNRLQEIPPGFNITIDLQKTRFVDHSVLENLHHIQNDYEHNGGKFQIIGLSDHKPISEHTFAARKKIMHHISHRKRRTKLFS